MKEIKIEVFIQENGKKPFEIWLNSLDKKTQTRILTRINRIREGNFGDNKHLQEGVWELKFDFGPGYRVYFGKEKDVIAILLAGGDKDSQKKDIAKAREYWFEHLN